MDESFPNGFPRVIPRVIPQGDFTVRRLESQGTETAGRNFIDNS